MSSPLPHSPPVLQSARDDQSKTWLLFVIAGGALIVAGGLVAAIGGEAPSKHLSWAAAYLVLVAGAAQVGLGAGRVLISVRQGNARLIAGQFISFNLGNAGVLIGTLTGTSLVLYFGSAVFVVALALFAWDVRTMRTLQPRGVLAYWALVFVLALSVPIGATLGH